MFRISRFTAFILTFTITASALVFLNAGFLENLIPVFSLDKATIAWNDMFGRAPSGTQMVQVGDNSSSTTYYVATNGSDSNSGTKAQPFKTLKHTLSLVAQGDTIYLREGRYFEHGVRVTVNGTFDAPITISSYPGERAVLDSGHPDFQNPPTKAWKLVDATIHLYRSKHKIPKKSRPGAWLIDYDIQLPHYVDYALLRSTDYDYPNNYIGPGIHHADDGYVYIRLEQNPNDLTDKNGDPVNLPFTTLDPNELNINLLSYHRALYFDKSSYVVVENLEIGPTNYTIELSTDSHHLTFRNNKILLRSYGILSRGAHHVMIEDNEVRMGFPQWVYWGDVKSHQWKPAYYAGWNSFSISGTFPDGIVTRNTFYDSFDAIRVNGPNAKVTYNTIIGSRDDAIDLSADAVGVEVAHNIIRHCTVGISIIGKDDGPFGNESIFIHHNIIDVSGYFRGQRKGSEERSFSGDVWNAGGVTFGSHSCSDRNCDTTQWKVYNNTVIGRDTRRLTPKQPDHEYYNNILFLFGRNNFRDYGNKRAGNVFWRTEGGLFGFSEPQGLEIDPQFDLDGIQAEDYSNPSTFTTLYLPRNSQINTPGYAINPSWPESQNDYRGALPPDAQISLACFYFLDKDIDGYTDKPDNRVCRNTSDTDESNAEKTMLIALTTK